MASGGPGLFLLLTEAATASPPAPVKQQWFEDYVASLNPLHWYRLNEAPGITKAVDHGSLGWLGTYRGTMSTDVLEGAVLGPGTERSRWFNNRSGDMAAPGRWPARSQAGFSVSFWILQGDDYNAASAELMGYMAAEMHGIGFTVRVLNNEITFRRHVNGMTGSPTVYSITVESKHLPNFSNFSSISAGDFALYTFTVDEAGVMRAFVNAQEVAAPVNSGVAGHIFPPNLDFNDLFTIGTIYGHPPQNIAIDEVAVFGEALKRSQISALYLLGKYGKGFSGINTQALGGFTGYPVTQNTRPAFTASEDISDYVLSVSVEEDMDTVIDTSTMIVAKNHFDPSSPIILPNDYILVEELVGDGITMPETWEDVGHFLVEGEPSRAHGAAGSAKAQVNLRSLTKLLQMQNPLNKEISADKIKFKLEKLERTGATPDGAWEIKLPRKGSKELYLDKWVPAPSPSVYCSAFRNKKKEPGKDDEYSTSDMPPKILVKGAQNAFIVLPGRGIIQVDPDFYDAPIGYGLGDPDPETGLHITGERFCSYEDVTPATVAGVYAKSGRWMLALSGILPIYNPIGDVEAVHGSDSSDDLEFSDSASAGDWGHSSARISDVFAYENFYRTVDTADQTVEYTSGPSVDRIGFLARTGPDQGILEVVIDGAADFIEKTIPTVAELKASDPDEYGHLTLDDTARIVSLYSSTLDSNVQIMAAMSLVPSTHKILLKCTGEKQASSSGTAVNFTGFVSGDGDPTPVGRDLGRSMFVDSGSAKGKKFQLFKPYELLEDVQPAGTPAYASTAAQEDWSAYASFSTATIGWTGDLVGDVLYFPDLGNGAPSSAAGTANTQAAYSVPLDDAEITYPLHLTDFSYASELSEDTQNAAVAKITVVIRRSAAALRTAETNMFDSYPWSKWGDTGYVKEKWIGLSLDGAPLQTNKAAENTLVPPYQVWPRLTNFWARNETSDFQNSYFLEEATYSYTPEQWGLQKDFTMSDLTRLGVVIQAEGNKNASSGSTAGGTVAVVESVKILCEMAHASGNITEFVVLNQWGRPCCLSEEGLAVGDSVRVGDCGAVEDVVADLLRDAGFQAEDSAAPFYFNIESMPSELKAITVPRRFSVLDGITPDEAVAETLQAALPNFFLKTESTGITTLKPYMQKEIPDYVLPASSLKDVAQDTTDLGVYTSALVQGCGGYSINAAAGYRAAIRAMKFTHWATDGSTPSGTGESSLDGLSYDLTEANMTAMNQRLAAMIDTANDTPHFTSGGWTKAQSVGVLWARRGSSLNRFSMEDEDLFVIDIGRTFAGLPHRISQLQFSFIPTYPWDEGTYPAVQFFYLTEEDYQTVFGTLPPDEPDQGEANKVDSYMPSSKISLWRAMTDRVPIQKGLNTVEASSFIDGDEVPARFIMCRLLQAHYFDGKGNSADQRSRFGFTEFGVYTSRKIRATATIGVNGDSATDDGRELMARLRRRLFIIGENPYIEDYETGAGQALVNMQELGRDFAPTAITTVDRRPKIGDTVSFVDGKGQTRTAMVRGVGVPQVEQGMRTLKLVNYLARQAVSEVYY